MTAIYFWGMARFRTACLIALSLLIASVVLPGVRASSGTGMVWSVAGQTNTVFLAGSIHLLREEDHPLPGLYEEVLSQSDVLVVEITDEAMMSPQAVGYLMQRAVCGPGKTSGDYVSEKTLGQFETYFMEKGKPNPLSAEGRFRPWFIGMGLMQTELMAMGMSPAWGVETVLSREARERNMPVESLESVEFQVDLLADLAGDDEDGFLRQVLLDLEIVQEQSGKMVKFWKAGNARGLDELLNQSFETYPEVKEQLLLKRNRSWFEAMEEDYLQRPGDVMILVGAGHLVGDGSLVALCREAGLEVERLGEAGRSGKEMP